MNILHQADVKLRGYILKREHKFSVIIAVALW